MEIIYQPHVDREIESFIERIHPPRVCIDNDSCSDCSVVKIDSANKYGILLEMVQALTDLDLVISKSYICSDGGWLMDVFHVTDQAGNKLTDESLVHYIQQALCKTRNSKEISSEIEVRSCSKGPQQKASVSTGNVAIEVTATDRPGLFSEISAVLVGLGFNVTSATAWTHNDRVACIINLEDASKPGPISDPDRLAHVEDQIQNVMRAHEGRVKDERRSVRLRTFAAGRSHIERRLHQMMYDGGDYESCRACYGDRNGEHKKGCDGTHVFVGRYEGRGYWVVNVRSRDRPKLLFDTVCVLTDMQYEVFHAAVSSKSSTADQEYFIRKKGGSIQEKESERQKLTLCLIAAIERRVPHVCPMSHTNMKGLTIDIRAQNRMGLLSNVTRVIRENGLSITRAEIGVEGEIAAGSFYVTDSSGQNVNPNIAELVRREIDGSIVTVHNPPYMVPQSRTTMHEASSIEVTPRFSLGSMLWSQLERLSHNFGPIRS